MHALVVDLETTVQRMDDGTVDNSPFNPLNKIVSAHWAVVDTVAKTIGERHHAIFHHNDQAIADSSEEFQKALEEADCIVAHNLKFDLSWLMEAHFRTPDKLACTYIQEYILSRGVTIPLSLKETSIRRKVTNKKSDVTEDYWKQGIGFEAIPIPILVEYADTDVLSCAEIYLQQLDDFMAKDNETLQNIVILMTDMLVFILNIEKNGICIDLERLNTIQRDYENELKTIQEELQELAQSVMGDTPINLRSNVDVSKVIYSREVIDRDMHKMLFNIGLRPDGKKKQPPFMTDKQFIANVRKTTSRVYRTTAEHCYRCHGKGWIQKVKIDGTNHKNTNKCPACAGRGCLFIPSSVVAGFKLIPLGPASASINGFVCDKEDIDRLIIQARVNNNLDAIAFLTKKKRLNAINTYLNSFVKGIKRWVRGDHLLHAGFNQCITKTGRLSSSNPH